MSKYYVVFVGITPGIYDNWIDCQSNIFGFKGSKYKSFKSFEEAEKAYNDYFNTSTSIKHPHQILNTSNPELAKLIGDMSYDSLEELLLLISQKIENDSQKDLSKGRKKLAKHLWICSKQIECASTEIQKAWKICEPYMATTKVEEHPLNSSKETINYNSISVDGACSGNPGLGEYQIVDTKTKETIIHHNNFEKTTNNIMEFFALVEALKYIYENRLNDLIIYTDSLTALSWVKNRNVKTTLNKNEKNIDTFLLIKQYEKWLLETNIDISIIHKWDTKNWGEIPADFGRK